MDVFNLLSYINKISLVAFFITILVVGYQIYIIKKEKTKEQAPSIPDFKENYNLGVVANFTNLPSSLTKKEVKAVNYSKMIFLIISILTVIVVIFVVSLVNKNNISNNQTQVNPPTGVPQVLVSKKISPTPKVILLPSLSATVSAELTTPTTAITPTAITPTVILTQTQLIASISATVVPTEIIIAKASSPTPLISLTNGASITSSVVPSVLPETGSLEKGLLIIGVAISTIFFSFWF